MKHQATPGYACAAITALLVMTPIRASWAEGIAGVGPVDRRAMQGVCERSAAVSVDPKGHVHCTVCPSYTDFHGTRESFDLWGAYRGHFSMASAEQLLLVLDGCESHASGFGGSVLLTRNQTAWEKSAYFKGYRPSKCLPFTTRSGLDLLVCVEGDMHFGNFVAWINAVSFKDNALHAEPLIKDISGNTAAGSPVAGYCYEQMILSFEKLPSDAGVRIAISQGKKLARAGETACGENESNAGHKETITIQFRFDGEHFIVAPQSKDSLQKVENFAPHQ